MQQSLLFPLLILSGMMLPLETGPDWMQALSKLNPLTYIVDAERVLFSGTFDDSAVVYGIVAAIVTAAVGLGSASAPSPRPSCRTAREAVPVLPQVGGRGASLVGPKVSNRCQALAQAGSQPSTSSARREAGPV